MSVKRRDNDRLSFLSVYNADFVDYMRFVRLKIQTFLKYKNDFTTDDLIYFRIGTGSIFDKAVIMT